MSETLTIKIEINGVVYPVSCISGEEDRLIRSAKEVNQVIADLSNISKTVGETRLLAMSSLILADKLIEKENAVFASQSNYLIPCFGFLWSFIFLDERLTLNLFMGLILIVLGAYLVNNK